MKSAIKKTPVSEMKEYTYSSNSLVTIIDKKSMEKLQHHLDNPSMGTTSLKKLLEQIDCERKS